MPYALNLRILTLHSFRACRSISVGIIRLLLLRLLMHVRFHQLLPLLLFPLLLMRISVGGGEKPSM